MKKLNCFGSIYLSIYRCLYIFTICMYKNICIYIYLICIDTYIYIYIYIYVPISLGGRGGLVDEADASLAGGGG